MKIISQIDEKTFVVRLEDKDTEKNSGYTIGMAHDYVLFEGKNYIPTDRGVQIQHTPSFSSNSVGHQARLQIGIKTFAKVFLPLLMKHRYMQEEHFKDRDNNGETYPAYSYMNSIAHYYDEDRKKMMTAYSRKGIKEFTHVEMEEFNNHIKATL